MARYKIILNPVSGRGAGAQAAPEVERLLGDYGLDYELALTQEPMHAVTLAGEAARRGFDVVVAVGGDGTANEVLNGLMGAKSAGIKTPTLGLLPVGRGNDFAYGVGLPEGMEACCRVLAEGQPRAIDVGLVKGGIYPQGRFFGNGVGIGFDAVVGFEAIKMKRLHGFPSYLVAALKTIFLYYRAPRVKIEIDDRKLEQYSLLISIMNGRRMGGGFMMAPEAEPGDGLLDLCIAKQVSKARIMALIPRFMAGTQVSHPAIQSARARRVRVTALEGSLPAHADGETMSVAGRQLGVEIHPGAISILTPEQHDKS